LPEKEVHGIVHSRGGRRALTSGRCRRGGRLSSAKLIRRDKGEKRERELLPYKSSANPGKNSRAEKEKEVITLTIKRFGEIRNAKEKGMSDLFYEDLKPDKKHTKPYWSLLR